MTKRVPFTLAILALWIGISDAQQPPTEIIVSMKPGQSIANVLKIAGGKVVRQIPGEPIYLVQDIAPATDATLQKFARGVGVDIVEFNKSRKLQLGPTTTATDGAKLVQSMAALLDGNSTTNFYGTEVLKAYSEQAALQIIGATATRDRSTGAGTRIGYIDTGVDPDHPALRAFLDPGIDLVGSGTVSEFDGMSANLSAWVRGTTNPSKLDGRLAFLLNQSMAALLDGSMAALLDQSMAALLDGSGLPPSPVPAGFGHGTLVAGAIHAVAPNARIVPVRAFDASGNTTIFKLAEGTYRLADAGVDVVNMSFSTREASQTLQRAVIYAQGKKVALVASAGNENRDVAGVFPAAYATVCDVAATDFYDHLASFSNYGSGISVSAPGAYVISTAPGGRYAMAWGTSFSTPLVAGSIGLVAALHPRGYQNMQIVTTTADNIDALNPAYAKKMGGRVNLVRALQPGR